MLAFLKVRRNQVVFSILAVLLVVLGVLAFLQFFPPSKPAASNTSSSATVSPSPSESPTPAIDRTPSPKPSAQGTPIGAAGAILKTGTAPDDTPTLFGNGPGCSIWHHPGWTQDKCDIVQVSGSNTTGAVAWVTEHKSANASARRVSLMTTGPSDTAWKVKLYAVDDAGGSFTAITVRVADVTGDHQPEVFVGLRAIGTNHVLELDGVQRLTGHDPAVIIHRELVQGRALLTGGGLTDYSATGASYTRTEIVYTAGAFKGTSTTVPILSAPAGDFE
jgi:hypothetical protein